jgi:hypothetical protein
VTGATLTSPAATMQCRGVLPVLASNDMICRAVSTREVCVFIAVLRLSLTVTYLSRTHASWH